MDLHVQKWLSSVNRVDISFDNRSSASSCASFQTPGHQSGPKLIPGSMSETKVTKPPTGNADESYDRYKRPKWQPILLLAAASILMLALKLDIYDPRSLVLFMIPSSILSLDQRVIKIISLTPLIGVSSSSLRTPLTTLFLCRRTRRPG